LSPRATLQAEPSWYGEESSPRSWPIDHDVNEGKVKAISQAPVALANIDEGKKAGFAVGYVSPGPVVNTVPGSYSSSTQTRAGRLLGHRLATSPTTTSSTSTGAATSVQSSTTHPA
jgi:hypothetical protein